MKRLRIVAGWLIVMLVMLLAGCGADNQPFDAEAVDVILEAEAADPNGETRLVATLTGEQFPEQTFVQFDIRVDLIPRLLDGASEGGDVYTTSYKFPGPGIYDVYMHLYIEDLHLMKLKQVEIR